MTELSKIMIQLLLCQPLVNIDVAMKRIVMNITKATCPVDIFVDILPATNETNVTPYIKGSKLHRFIPPLEICLSV